MKNRRSFIKKTTLYLAGITFLNSISAKSYRKIIGSNERINIAFQGLGRRIPGLMSGALAYKNIEVSYLCDVMDNQIKKASERYFNLTGKTTKSEKNIHRIFNFHKLEIYIFFPFFLFEISPAKITFERKKS